MVYINHIQAGSCCEILIDEAYMRKVEQFFSMFYVTCNDIGLKCIGQFRVEKNRGAFELTFLNDKIAFDSICECLLYVSDTFQHLCLLTFVGYYHSALCLNKKGKAILLVGASTAGKTSLNMFLCKNGFTYLSDDIAIINKNLKAISMPTAVKIRHGIIYDDSFFDQYEIYANNEIKVLGTFNKKTTEAAYDIAGILFLNRGYDLRIEKMTSSVLTAELMSNYFAVLSLNTQIKYTCKLASNVNGYRLFYNNLDDSLLRTIETL